MSTSLKLEGHFLQPRGSLWTALFCATWTPGFGLVDTGPRILSAFLLLAVSFNFFLILFYFLPFSFLIYPPLTCVCVFLYLSFTFSASLLLFCPFFVFLSISICPTSLPSIYSCFFHYRDLIVSKFCPFISGSMIDRCTSFNLTNVSSPWSKKASHGNQDAIVTILSIIPLYTYLNRPCYLSVNVHERCPLYFQAKWTENSLACPQFLLFHSFKFSTIFTFSYSIPISTVGGNFSIVWGLQGRYITYLQAVVALCICSMGFPWFLQEVATVWFEVFMVLLIKDTTLKCMAPFW